MVTLMQPPGGRGASSAPHRVTVTTDGPVLVDGPVEVELPDGTLVTSARPVVALCVCRRSRRFPFCDTSHRRKIRSSRSGEEG